ncbi:MAG: hypothetical protein N4A62_08780 [Marinisporobacter sp.]|nr:hypothetical protein [Marinisporobacter sp.]
MDQKRYRRYFIILDQEDSGFENKQGKKTKGYAKLETKNGKGVLSQYVQNMKYFDDGEYIYRGYLIGTKGNKQMYTDSGTFVIDKNGKGELVWRFDPENVDGQGNSIKDFNVIAIIAESVEQRDKVTVAPLVGFIDKKKVDWKHILKNRYKKEESLEENMRTGKVVQEKQLSNEEVNDTSVKEETIDAEKEENIEEDIKKEEEVKEDTAETLKRGDIEAVVEEKDVEEKDIESQKKEEEVGEKEKFEIKDTQDIEKKVNDIDTKALKEAVVEEQTSESIQNTEEIKEEKVKTENFTEDYRCKKEKEQHEHLNYGQMKYYDCKNPYQYYQQYSKMIYGYVENILKYHKEVEPFKKNIGKCKWWKIDSSRQTLYRNFLPFYGYVNNMYCYYPYRNYIGCPPQIYKYKHYIFGIMGDEKNEPVYYLYGVPGRFMLNEQPYEGMTGFVYWHPIEKKKTEKGDYGYWILHIDAKTGNVAIPLKPTIPPR